MIKYHLHLRPTHRALIKELKQSGASLKTCLSQIAHRAAIVSLTAAGIEHAPDSAAAAARSEPVEQDKVRVTEASGGETLGRC